MANWSWLVLAVALLAAEILFIDAQFFLIFLGVAAAVVGIVLSVTPISPVMQWLLFAVLAILALVLFRQRLYTKLRTPQDSVPDSLSVGDRVTLPAPLAPSHSCRVEYRGSTWTARNVDNGVLDGEVAIVHVEGLTLLVKQVP